jgi:hypothetical protein
VHWVALHLIKGLTGCIGIIKAYTGQPIECQSCALALTSIFVWHLTGKLYGAMPRIKRDNGGPQATATLLFSQGGGGGGGGGLGYTKKCIIETIGWFDILIDYCNIFTLIL